jgi:hypothetical protein
MSKTIRNLSLAFALMVMAAPMLGSDVQAKDSFMKTCSLKFKAAKANNAPEGNMKWTDFMKSQCAADATADAPAPAPTTTKTKAKTTATVATPATTPSGSFIGNCSTAWKDMKAKNAVPAGMTWKSFVASKCVVPAGAANAATDSTAAGGTFMQRCSAAWQAMKDAGTTPAGMSWKDFVAGKCVATGTVAATTKKTTKKPVVVDTTMDETPAEADAVDQAPLKTVDKNGKAFTPGQMASHQRARDCGAKWRGNKPTFQAQYGTWPKYWSACNAELKAQGQ